MIKKYTTKTRKFEFSFDRKFITVYQNGVTAGFIWNCDKVIFIDGEKVLSSDFFK